MYQPSVLPTRNIYHCLNFFLVYLGCSVRVGWWWVAGVWSIQHSLGQFTMCHVVHSPPIIWLMMIHSQSFRVKLYRFTLTFYLSTLKHVFSVTATRPRINVVSLKKVSSWICVKGFSESIFFNIFNWCLDFYELWMTLRVLLSPQHTGPITINCNYNYSLPHT